MQTEEELLDISEKLQLIRDENRAYAAKLEKKIAHVEGMLRGAGGELAGGAALAAAEEKRKNSVAGVSAVGGRQPGVHVVVTSNGNRYMNWQTRVLYASYKRTAQEPDSLFKAFTRVLHRTSDDELMHEVPTRRFDPLQPDCDVWCEYPVADRSKALEQWLQTPDAKRLEHILIIETDYVFIAPPKLSPLPAKGHAVSFPFGYIVPAYPPRVPIIKKYYSGSPHDIPQTGNAPVLMRFEDFEKVCPLWVELTAKVQKDAEAIEAFGWVREMYAYSIAAAIAGVKHDTPEPPRSKLMVQPPADDKPGEACIAHYTWGAIFTDRAEGKEVWRWDKREYASGQYGDKTAHLQRIPDMPPWKETYELQDRVRVSKGKYDLLNMLVTKFNEAVDAVNAVNGGIPEGLSSWEEADKLMQPSKRAVDAHAREEEVRQQREIQKRLHGGNQA